MVSPRVAARSGRQIVIDVEGLERLVGDARAIGERLRQAAADRGIAPVHVAVAGTCTAAMLLAVARAGVTVVAEGEEAAALAPLPLRTLAVLAGEGIEVRSQKTEARKPEFRPAAPSPESRVPNPIPSPDCLAVLARWGLRTLGELAALPAADLSERLGQDGIRWQRLARGEDTGPLVPAAEEEPFEASLELEWPIAELEPLSFVLTRLLEPLCQRLEHRDRGAAVLHLRLRLVTRDLHLRSLQLPAPMRDPKVLRTLLLLDLESHPAPAGIDAVTVAIDPTPGRIVQESLLTRALPAPELVSTLVARLQALVGEGRCGSPATVDSYRPGAFAHEAVRGASGRRRAEAEARSQKPEEVASSQYSVASRPNPESRIPESRARALRRFRLPIPARVLMDGSRPISVRTDRPALAGGRVQACGRAVAHVGRMVEDDGRAGRCAAVGATAAHGLEPRRVGRGPQRRRPVPHLRGSRDGTMVRGGDGGLGK